MGNCIDLFISPSPPQPQAQLQNKIKVLTFNGEEKEFISSTPINHITSGPYDGCTLVHHAEPHLPLTPHCQLLSGEVYFLIPHLTISCIAPASQKIVDKEGGGDGGGGRCVKVVVTKKELVELLFKGGNQEGFVCNEEFANRVMDRSRAGNAGCKWRPGLETIPEL